MRIYSLTSYPRYLINYLLGSKCWLTPQEMTGHIESQLNRVKKLFNGSAEASQSPRFIQTHLPYELLPKKLRDGSTTAKVLWSIQNLDIIIGGERDNKIATQKKINSFKSILRLR